MKNHVVIAGNMKQFHDFARDKAKELSHYTVSIGSGRLKTDDEQWFYLSSPDRLRGLREYSVIRCGTWFNRKDLDQIEDLLNIARMSGALVDSK